MKYIFAIAQILAMICLVALAFPQVDRLNGIPDDDSDNAPTSPAPPSTTTNCPCVATAEYNPICGTDNVTYWNRGRFNCAKNCNPNLEIRVIRACEPYIQQSSN